MENRTISTHSNGDISTPGVPAKTTVEHLAFHEAGHVAVGSRLGLKLLSADILRDGEGGRGHTHFAPPGKWFQPRRGHLSDQERDLIERVLTTFMAGFAAESRAGGTDEEGSGYDRDLALREWVSYLADDRGEAFALLQAFHERAERLLDDPDTWRQVERVATELRARVQLTGAELESLIDP